MRKILVITAIGLLLIIGGIKAVTVTKVYFTDGGDKQVVASGGELEVQSGGTFDHQSGGTLVLHGTTITATGTELNLTDGMAAITAVFTADVATCTLTTSGLTSTSQIVGLYVPSADSAYALTATILNTDSATVRRPGDDVTVAGADTVRALFVPNL